MAEENLIEQVAEAIFEKLSDYLEQHPAHPQLMYSREQAANLLAIKLSSLQELIDDGRLRVRRWGRRVLVPHSELERISKCDFATLWPERPDGKTRRRALG